MTSPRAAFCGARHVITMRRILALTLLLVSCTQTPAPRTAPHGAAAPVTTTAQRVVLLSFDGLGADALAKQPNLPAFERLAHEGATARVINVNPTLTSTTHVSIITGADPQRTGVVSNRFHLPGTPPEQVAKGMDTTSDVETIVEAARRQGKRVGAISYPTIDGTSPRRTADFGLAWSFPITKAHIVKLTRADFRREWVPPTWTARPQRHRSFSPVMRARLDWGVPRRNGQQNGSLRADVDVVAYDTTNDHVENYDTWFVESGDREIVPDARGWFALSQQYEGALNGSWSKFLQTSPSLDATIYWGAIHRNHAWPESFQATIDQEAGFWPGEGEEDADVGAATFTEQNVRLAEFLTRVQTLSIERMPFDLLLAYQPEIDGASHPWLGQEGGDAPVRAAFEAADRAVAAIGDALTPSDALVVTGDHGLVVAQREVRLNRLLIDAGFGPRWRAYTSGTVAQIYRFGAPDDTDAVIRMLNATLTFEKIERKTASSHRNSGDITAFGWPSFAISDSDASPPVITPQPRGQHGALNTHREMHPPLFAIGQGVKPGPLGELKQTRIARYVCALLGIQPPATAE